VLWPSLIIDIPQPNPALNRDAVKHRASSLHRARRALALRWAMNAGQVSMSHLARAPPRRSVPSLLSGPPYRSYYHFLGGSKCQEIIGTPHIQRL